MKLTKRIITNDKHKVENYCNIVNGWVLPAALVSVARVSVRSVSRLPGLKDNIQ